MQEMRVLLEATQPMNGELPSAWFTLPILEDELIETLGIESDSEEFVVKDTDLPYDFITLGDETITIDEMNDIVYMFEHLSPAIQDEIDALMEEYDTLKDLFDQRDNIYHYAGCSNMVDVAKEFVAVTGCLNAIPENLQEHFDYASYGEELKEDKTWIITSHGVFELPY